MSYIELGKRAVELGVYPEDLERRVKILQREKKASREEIREMVTGFVDGSIEKNRPFEAYSVAEGFGRFLYNGNFEEVRSRILQLMAQHVRKDFGMDKVKRYFKKRSDDPDALDTIAELCVEAKPKEALALACDRRGDIVDKIIELHMDNPEHYELVADCLARKKDVENLRKLALKYAAEDPSFAWNIIQRHGMAEDIPVFARKAKDKNVQLAYKAVVLVRDAFADLHRKIRTKFINEHPRDAGWAFFKTECMGVRKCLDEEGVIELGKRLLRRDKHYDPADAIGFFVNVGYEGPELQKAALGVMRLVKSKKLDSQATDRIPKKVLEMGAIAYLQKGGNIEIINKYIPKETTDELNRQLARGLAELPDREDYQSIAAYERISAIKSKTRDDRRLLGELRKYILKEISYAGSIFAGQNDKRGMRMFISRNLKERPDDAYHVAVKLEDEELVQRCREGIMGSGLKRARYFFHQQKDEIGSEMVKKRLYKGVKPEVADVLLKN